MGGFKLKSIFIYSTCQGDAIAKILMDNDNVNRYFRICKIVRNYEYIKKSKHWIDDSNNLNALKNSDVLIYQPLDDIYGKNSTNQILKFIKPECIKISVPYVFNNSLTPIIVGNLGDTTDDWSRLDAHIRHIKNTDPIDNLISIGIKRDEILRMYDSDTIDWKYNERNTFMMSYLRNKEKLTDIKICDYIEENFKTKKLFAYYSHPTSDLLVYIINQILEILSINKILNKYSEERFLGSCNLFYYSTSSVNHFGLKYVSKEEMDIGDKFYRDIITKYIK